MIMLEAVLHSLTAVAVLVIVAGLGWVTARWGWYDDRGRTLLAKLVNCAIPFFLFYSVTSKFTHDQLLELLRMAFLPFLVVAINFCISLILAKMGVVRKEIRGAFIACFTASTVLFAGVPVTIAMFGAEGIPYLLVYFFANVIFIWTIGLYNIQLDGVRRLGKTRPRLFSRQSFKMFFSPPLLGFLIGMVFVLGALEVPRMVSLSTHMIGQMATPLALVFIGMTVEKVGFKKLLYMPREVWLILVACFVIRPLLMCACMLPFDVEPLMRQVFIIAACLPVSSVIAVMSRRYGADEEYASEAVSMSTIGLIFAAPVWLTLVNFM